jgi:hypothetical protein
MNTYNAFDALSTSSDTTPDPPRETNEAAAAAARQSKAIKKQDTKMTPSRKHVQHVLRQLDQQESAFLERSITRAENEATELAKKDTNNKQRVAIEARHKLMNTAVSFGQRRKNVSYSISSSLKRATNKLVAKKHVSFATKRQVREFVSTEVAAMITYDSGADGHYISEKDRQAAGLPILRRSTKRVGVANGGVSEAQHVTQLPFKQLSEKAKAADTFSDFPNSLMSVGKTADDGTVSIFTKDGVTVHKEEDVLITCKGQPILIGVTAYHWCNRKADGNRGHQRNESTRSCNKQIVCTICHPQSKRSSGCMPYADTRSSLHGLRQ